MDEEQETNDNSNVILFPTNYNPEITKESIEDNIESLKHHHINESLGVIVPHLFRQLQSGGFYENLSEDNEKLIAKDTGLIIEAMRSLMCKYYGMYHPFQQIASRVFSDENMEEGSFRIADTLNIELREHEETANNILQTGE